MRKLLRYAASQSPMHRLFIPHIKPSVREIIASPDQRLRSDSLLCTDAMPCHAHAMPCHAMQSNAMQSNAMQYHAMPPSLSPSPPLHGSSLPPPFLPSYLHSLPPSQHPSLPPLASLHLSLSPSLPHSFPP